MIRPCVAGRDQSVAGIRTISRLATLRSSENMSEQAVAGCSLQAKLF